MPSPAASLMSWVMRRRARLPRWVRRVTDAVEARPQGILSRAAYLALGGDRAAPPATEIPPGDPRVLIGPTNHAGQGLLWARALSEQFPGLGARSLAVTIPGTTSFPADSAVPFPVYHHSRRWQEAEFRAVASGFDRVLIESMRPIFGGRFPSVEAEASALIARGIRVALMAHGTDVRSPRRHAAAHRWSPFPEDPRTERLERLAGANRAIADVLGVPVFVSTPDLLDDLSQARWCPVVVDPDRWRTDAPPLPAGGRPVVLHAPSSGPVKGTALIEPTMTRLHDEGVIEYRRLEGVPAARMPDAVREADIVLDQFRLGSYGVAACEAMAAQRIVVGHVAPHVRRRVADDTGQALPVVEADVETLEAVLRELVARRSDAAAIGEAGARFVSAVHSGGRSAEVLRAGWLDASP
jgi:hypothetical protein